jgi:hypothetical protein
MSEERDAAPNAAPSIDRETADDGTVALAERACGAMGVEELRAFMSDAGLVRSRGADKFTSALQAAAQAPGLVDAAAEARRARYEVTCACGLEESHGDAGAAEDAARAHKSDNPTHFPRAVDAVKGEALYG